MAKASEQFKHSDVTKWGLAALVCGAFAVLCANVSLQMPSGTLSWLHSSRIDSGNMGQLRIEVAALTQDTQRLRRDNATLLNRIALAEEVGGEVNRRVGALEVSIPTLLEALPAGADIDRGAVTAAIDSDKAVETFDADGGTVSVSTSPMPGATTQDAGLPAAQPIPPVPDAAAYGVALGPAIATDQGKATWDDLTLKVGADLAGLDPLLSGDDPANQHLVAGPILKLSDATQLCQKLEQVAISCLPMPYSGTKLE